MSHETADFRYEGASTKSLVDVFGSSIETKRWSFRKKKQVDRVAFVFSGGGNKGACQVGMLEGLVKNGFMPEIVVGCSVGSLNAAAFAKDPTLEGVEKLKKLWLRLSSEDIFPKGRFFGAWRFIEKRPAVFSSFGLEKVISGHMGEVDFEDLKIPLQVVAASLHTGKEVWIDKGNVTKALLASTALPGIFPPVYHEDVPLIDGGVLNDAPISKAIELGATKIFLLSCSTLERKIIEPLRPIESMLYAFGMAVTGRLERELEELKAGVEIIVLQFPGPYGLDWRDFDHSSEMIQRSFDLTNSHFKR